MIYLASEFIGYKIFSLSSLNEVGVIIGIIIDPYRFSVLGFWIETSSTKRNDWLILLSQSVRQIEAGKVLINDVSDFNKRQDLPRVKTMLKIDYQIPGKKIVSTNAENLGQAEDFSFKEDNFQITHIIAKPPLHQRFKLTKRHYTRSQIEKISRKSIEVNVEPQAQKLQPVSPTN